MTRAPLLTVAEVAELLSVSPEHARRLVLSEIVHLRVGKSIRVPQAAIDKWLKQNEVKPCKDFSNEAPAIGSRSSLALVSGSASPPASATRKLQNTKPSASSEPYPVRATQPRRRSGERSRP